MYKTGFSAIGKVFVTLLFTLLLAPAAFSQLTNASITGRIEDSTGKVVPGAKVTAIDKATSRERTVTTNEDGDFVITDLVPGRYSISAEAQGFSRSVREDVELNVGTRATFNFSLVNVNVDGGDNKDNVVGSLLQNFSYESIQEFQVLQHRWTAEQGRAVGGIVNVITKSGGNDFHGSFFTNFRDEAWRSFDFFEKQRRVANPSFKKPSFERQEFGGSVGGPILKEKLFFFFALERFRERQNVPASANAIVQIPLIPGAAFVPEIATPYNDLLLSAKIDHRISDNQSMFYRYSYQKNDSPNDQVGQILNTDANGGNTNDNKLHSFVVNHTYNFSPTTLNQFTFHYQDFSNAILGITTAPLLTFPGSIQIGANINTPQATTERKYQFRDDFTWIRGNHNMKFGVNYINTELGGFFFFGAKGYVINFFDSPQVISTNRLPNGAVGPYTQGFATPGAVQSIQFSDGEGTHDQKIHQTALYVQDDWKVTRKLTLNLGLRWDANIGNLPDQTNNRTIKILKLLNNERARAITGDDEKLARTTPNWLEFQPRLGFAYDPWGEGKTVIRGGYGIFYDQLFQNLTLFSLTQSNPALYQTALNRTNNAVGVGQLATFRYGVDPLPTPPADFSFADLAFGGFGRINDPDASEPYIQKFSIGFQHEINRKLSVSSDYVHTLGLNESRVQNINPLIRNICDPNFPGSTPSSPRCPRGAVSRFFDQAFNELGLIRFTAGQPITTGVARAEQINMIGTTNRSLFDSWTTTFKYRTRKMLLNASYVLASSRSWGGQPVASYTGNGIATIPENQFKEEEFGPTRFDERHRVVISGVFNLPWDFQISPILQYATARPYSANAGLDLDGDGLTTNDRICQGVDPQAVFAVRGNSAAIQALNPRGCVQSRVNSQRSGFIVDSSGNVREASGRFFNVDLRINKTFRFGERFAVAGYVDLYNLFNTENLALADRFGRSPATSAAAFLQPQFLFGPGFGPQIGRPFTAQFGARFTF
ncbi:MAG: TonB-dependent receptor [Acidobacteria bacterium]|nr:TonB-dependent receptor [Acidobacteriota bacterium]